MNMVTAVKGDIRLTIMLFCMKTRTKKIASARTGHAHAVGTKGVSNCTSVSFHPCISPNFEHYYRHLLQLLLWPKLVCVSTLLLAAVSGSGWQTGLFDRITISILLGSYHKRLDRTTYITFPANHLVAIILARESLQAGLDDTATETEDKMKG